MKKLWLAIACVTALAGCVVGDPEPATSPEEATEEADTVTLERKCRTNCTPAVKRCLVDSTGRETGRCVWHGTNFCAYSVSTLACVAGRTPTSVTHLGCGNVSENTCDAGTWVF